MWATIATVARQKRILPSPLLYLAIILTSRCGTMMTSLRESVSNFKLIFLPIDLLHLIHNKYSKPSMFFNMSLTYYLIIITPFIFSVLAGTIQPLPAQAQIRGADSQELFEEGNEQMQQDIQALKEETKKKAEPLLLNEGTPTVGQNSTSNAELERSDIQELDQEREKKEEQLLEETLNIQEKNPNEPKIQDVPGSGEELGLDDNLPEQPADEEAEIKF
jgi:hypothetical protein